MSDEPRAHYSRLSAVLGGEAEVALSLGSGLAPTARHLGLRVLATFAQLGLAPVGVPGHSGQISAGSVDGVPVVAFEGRLHLYEGHSLWDVTACVRLAREAGAHKFVLTNAAGGLAPALRPGDIMLITDHISLPGLVGYRGSFTPGEEGYPWPRFLSQDELYDRGFAQAARAAACSLGEPLTEGVYAMVHGPSYETPAERRFLRALGADAVGMSTAPEASAAFGAGGRVLGLSIITNVANSPNPPIHEEVTRVTLAAAERLANLLRATIPALT